MINHDQKLRIAEGEGREHLVLVAGDISWAMRLEEALPDLSDQAGRAANSDPGQPRLLVVKYRQAEKKLDRHLALQMTAFTWMGGICGTRG